MNTKTQTVGQFVQDINREIVSAIISRQPVPMNPEKSVMCFMADARVQFDVRVNGQGEVTDDQNVAAKLHFEFRYLPEGKEN